MQLRFSATYSLTCPLIPTNISNTIGRIIAGRIARRSAKQGIKILKNLEGIDIGAGPIQHFTNAGGTIGITGVPEEFLESMQAGDKVVTHNAYFRRAENPYFTGEGGNVGITEIGVDASSGQLNAIGVYGDKQQYAVEFSRETVFKNNLRVRADDPQKLMFSLPPDSVLDGVFIIHKRF